MNYWTPLHFAATNNAKEMGELLLAHGAEVNAQSISVKIMKLLLPFMVIFPQ